MKTRYKLICKTALPALAIASLLLSVPAKADIILSAESVTGAPSSTGTFDVLLTNTGPSSQNIAAFNFELTTADTNITFTDVTTSTTTATYIFPVSFFGPDITTPTLAGPQTVEAGDVDATFIGTDVAPGATVGLGSVSYSIDPGALNGDIAEIDFSAYPQTSLSDSGGFNVDFTPQSGTITVQTSTVPEPSQGGLMIFVLAGSAILLQRRRT